ALNRTARLCSSARSRFAFEETIERHVGFVGLAHRSCSILANQASLDGIIDKAVAVLEPRLKSSLESIAASLDNSFGSLDVKAAFYSAAFKLNGTAGRHVGAKAIEVILDWRKRLFVGRSCCLVGIEVEGAVPQELI